jgi:filamentous hemagglutinin family protein
MNAKRFKVIFSKRRGALIAVGENASSVTKAPGTSGAISFVKPSAVNVALQGVAFAVSAIFLAVHTAYAEPTGGEFAAGAGAISQAGNLTTIQQNTQHAIVNWQSFGSDAGETIRFVQPNVNAAILNRVVGDMPSNLNGVLEGNGRVYLINQNGIMLGKEGVINVNGGFVGSTRDVNNEAFMAGGALIYKGESIGNIQILGKVKSDQGDIVLIAQKVDVKAGAELVAGEKVQLVAANEVQLTNGKITIKPSTTDKGQITVEGAVKAAQVQLLANNNNLGALAINTIGTIRATGTQTNPDGSVTIVATGEGGNINISGNIRSEKGNGNGGEVTVLADNAIRVSGMIDANSTDATKKGGDIIIGRDIVTGQLAKATDVSGATLLSNKGFVETSGDYLATDGVSVKAAQWLLDPSDITISNLASSNVTGTSPGDITPNGITGSSSNVLVSTITGAINNGTNVTIKTTNASNASGAGNITIANALTFTNNTADATLSLIADNGIIQNAAISATGTKLVNINMEAKGNYQGNSIGPNINSQGITLNSNITTNGSITLTGTSNAPNGASGIGVNSNGTLSAGGNVLVTGTANGNSTGVNTGAITTGGSVTVIGTSATAKGATTGVINAAGDVTITGTSGIGASIGSLTGATTGAITSGGNVKVTGTSGSAAGVIVNAITGKDIVIVGNSTTGAVLGGTSVINATAGGVSITGTGNNGNGFAITTNNTITATGDIVINTTSAAKHGITLGGAVKSTGGAVTIYADVQTNGSGSAINGNHAITAKNDISITGKTNGFHSVNGLGVITSLDRNVAVQGLSTGVVSIGVNLTNSISAINGHVALTGSSGNVEGVIFGDGTGINAKSYNVQGTSATSVGVKFNGTTTFNSSTVSVIEGKNSSGGTGVFAAGATINIDSGTGKVAVRNQAGTNTGGMELRSGTVVNTKGDVTFGRNDQANNAMYLQALKATATGGKLTFLGSSSSKDGIGFQDFGGSVVDIKGINGAKILIDGKSTANGASGVNMRLVAGVNHLVTSSGPGGSIDIIGTSILGKGVNVDLAKITSNNGNVINITGNGGGTSEGVYIANAVTANGGGNINITGDTTTNNGTGTAVSINNNGGAGKVEANGAAGVPAGKITIIGDAGPSTGPGSGMGIFNSALITGGAVDMTGTGRGAGEGFYSFGTITSTVGGVSIKGTVTGSSGSIGTHIQGPVTAQTDINLEGYTAGPSQGLLIQSTAVTSTAGDITVKGENKWNNGRAVSIFDGVLKNVAGGKTININANTLFMTGTTSTSVDAGSTGTVNIKTLTPGNEIKIGSSDMGSSTLGSQILGIEKSELDRITAGKLVIGDTASAGNITVDVATTTLAQTGNVSLQTGGNIAVNAALTVGDAAATKNLILDAGSAITNGTSGKLTATNLTLKAGSTIGAMGAAIKTAVANASLNSAGSQFLVEDSALTVAAKSNGGDINITTTNGTMEVGTVNSLSGIDAGTGNVDLKATSSTGDGLHLRPATFIKGKNIEMVAKSTAAVGIGFRGLGGSFEATESLKLTGTTTGTGNGFYTFGGTLKASTGIKITGTSDYGQGVGFDANAKLINTTGDILIKGTAKDLGSANNGVNASNTQGIGFRGVSIENSGGEITLEAVKGQIFADTGNPDWGLGSSLANTITQNGTGNVKLTTVGNGNIIVPKIINNGTGNVVIAAGSDLMAGNGGGGQVKTVAGNTITQTNPAPGNTYIYSGSAAGTGLLSRLDSSFSQLRLSGDMGTTSSPLAQNADSNVKYAEGTTIASGANAQVMFREKIALNTSTITGATLDKTYGDTNTTSASGDKIALFAEMQTQLKQANLGEIITRSFDEVTNGAGEFKISKAALINDMTGSLSAPLYSTSDHLTAKTHDYGALTSSKYTATLDAGKAKVEVDKAALIISGITASDKVYNGDASATVNAAGFVKTGLVGSDVVTVSSVGNFRNAGNTADDKNVARDGSGAVIAKTVALSNTYAGADAGNYTITDQATTTAKITPAALIISGITASDKVYNGDASATVNAAGFVKTGLVGSDVVTVSSVGNFRNAGNTADDKNVARDGSGAVIAKTVALSNTYAGADAGNYTITDQATTTAKITPKSVTISAAGNTVIFNSKLQEDKVNAPDVIKGDIVGVEGAGAGTQEGTYQSNLRLSGAVDDSSNYNVTLIDATFTITAQTYVRPPVETNILSPVSFGLAYAGGATAAGGDGVDIAASCDAWSQRAGTGSVAVMTLLKSTFMGLRNAKTDSMDAMNGGLASASAVDTGTSSCGSSSLANKQAGL